MKVANKSHYYNLHTRQFNEVADTNSFIYDASRRLGYSQRLYWEFEYTKLKKGKAFFYTLTYNDAHIPYYLGMPCFSYKDIRLVTNGLITKELKRKYGCSMRYFIACETGEGKGSRGEGKNPHYHMILFVVPDNQYSTMPSDTAIRSLIRRVWHGSDQYVDYKNARFGIAREGDNLGVVDSIAALKYVSKYVLKDAYEVHLQTSVYDHFHAEIDRLTPSFSHLIYYYRYNVLLADNIPLHDLYYKFGLDHYCMYRRNTNVRDDLKDDLLLYYSKYAKLSAKVAFSQFMQWFNQYYKPMLLRQKMSYFNTNHSGKVRCSKSLGIYGVHRVQDIASNPTFSLPCVNGYEVKRPCLYYFRQLYYNKVKCSVTGNVLYRLNERGISLKKTILPSSINRLETRIRESMSIVNNNPYLGFDSSKNSRLNSLFHSDLCTEVLRRYCVYHLIYRYRYYDTSDFIALTSECDQYQYLQDYNHFLDEDRYLITYDYNIVSRINCSIRGCVSFDFHPAFYEYISTFQLIDYLLEFVSDYRSQCAKIKFQEKSDHQKRMNALKYNL